MSKELNDVFKARDKLIREAENEPAKLFRLIACELDVGVMKWNQLVTRYFKSRFSSTPKNPKEIGQDRNNFNRALARPRVTWNNFIKALMILGPQKIEINIKLHWKRNRITTHTVIVDNPLTELDDVVERKGDR